MVYNLFEVFDLSKEGRAYIQIHIKPYDNLELKGIDFKVDTGADMTTISKEVLTNELGYPAKWIEKNMVKYKIETTGAGQIIDDVYYIRIEKANILGRDLSNWPFFILSDKSIQETGMGKKQNLPIY